MNWKSFTPIVILLLIVVPGCKKIKDPEFRKIEKFRVKSMGLQSVGIGFSVTYYNPNNFGVSVKEAAADVYIDSIYLGKFGQDSLVTVKSLSVFSIPISGTISLQTALKMNLQNLPERDILIRADGIIKVGKAGIYLTRPIHYSGTHRLNDIQIQF
jgi:LEA14-like dessication related protein